MSYVRPIGEQYWPYMYVLIHTSHLGNLMGKILFLICIALCSRLLVHRAATMLYIYIYFGSLFQILCSAATSLLDL
jgi:hypothetical protein